MDGVETAHAARVEQSGALAHVPADIQQRDMLEQRPRLREQVGAGASRRAQQLGAQQQRPVGTT